MSWKGIERVEGVRKCGGSSIEKSESEEKMGCFLSRGTRCQWTAVAGRYMTTDIP